MASSSETYYAPTEFEVKDFVPNLVPEGNYKKWRSLMEDFIDRRGMKGFIDGTAIIDLEGGNEHDTAWKNSDNLVQAWILATVSDDIRLRLRRLKSAEAMWGKLEYSYDWTSWQFDVDEEAGNGQGKPVELHKAVIDWKWKRAIEIIEDDPNALTMGITSLSETVLIVAVQSMSPGRDDFVEKLLPKMNSEDLKRVDFEGSTALHYAALLNNTKVAKMLVEKNSDLPNASNGEGLIPLQSAAWCGHREVVLYLMAVTSIDLRDAVAPILFGYFISGELYDIASYLLEEYPFLALTGMEPNAFGILAEKRSSFLSGISFRWWERLVYWVPTGSERNNVAKLIDKAGKQGRDTQNGAAANCCVSVRQRLHLRIQEVAKKLEPYVPRIWKKMGRDNIWKKKERQRHALELVKALCQLVAKSNIPSHAERIYKMVLCKAVRIGIPDEIVEEIVFSYPSALFFKSVDDVNFIKYAIMYRRERVFNLIHRVGGAGWRCITGLDELSNNGLHLAARLGRKQQINLKASAAGAILHMQRELQWFQEVKSFTQPGEIDRRNADDKTPEELFSDTHQDLVKEGEQWMKNTAGSCTIVSALIVAMAFAAAITVPGGNNSNTGRPLLSREKAFIVFGISDALALLSSITSSLMFLLILTSRYAEEDFLLTLPIRLIFGLITLFFSILSTMIAFGAILFLVFGGDEALILIPIVVLASIPAILFGAMQFPLLLQMIQSTYFGGFFGQQKNRDLHQD